MNQPGRMRRIQGFCDRTHNLDGLVRSQSTGEQPGERCSFHESHRNKEEPLRFTGVVNRQDVRVLKSSSVCALAPEALTKRLVIHESLREHLESNRSS